MSMERYNTRARAEVPKREYLMDPVTFEVTQDYLEIISSLSDTFAEARDEALSVMSEGMSGLSKEERKKLSRECQLDMQAALVTGWSFDEEPTRENIREFLRNSRSALNMVLRVADDRKAFFSNPSTGFTYGLGDSQI